MPCVHVRVGTMGDDGENEQTVEPGIQLFSLRKEVSQDLNTWKRILLEEKPERFQEVYKSSFVLKQFC